MRRMLTKLLIVVGLVSVPVAAYAATHARHSECGCDPCPCGADCDCDH